MQVEEKVKLKINVIEESSWRVQNTDFKREEQVKNYLRRLGHLPPSTIPLIHRQSLYNPPRMRKKKKKS